MFKKVLQETSENVIFEFYKYQTIFKNSSEEVSDNSIICPLLKGFEDCSINIEEFKNNVFLMFLANFI